jgi:DNA-binding transcriptional LysR family regulator
MTLQQLTYFLAAAEHGSFSAAAETLHMAQPSLSEQIRRLEAELGVSLFARAGRRLELTEAGRLLMPHAERTRDAAREAAESVREVRDVTGGTVAFGTFGSAHHYLLGGLIQDFRTRHPSVRLRVIGQNSAEVADAVRDGHLEAGLVVLPVDDRGLDVRPAMQEELLYVSAEPRRTREPVTIERLAEAPLILYDARWGGARPRGHARGALHPRLARARPQALVGLLRAAAARDVRLHHPPQRPPVPGHPRLHGGGPQARRTTATAAGRGDRAKLLTSRGGRDTMAACPTITQPSPKRSTSRPSSGSRRPGCP